MKRSVLIVGNFLSASANSRGVCEDLAERLAARGWDVLTASRKRSKLFRLADMLGTALKRRDDYSVVHVDVFSGPAFFWAEAVCWMLNRLCKPFVLTLHGGNLPEFAKRWPGRVRRLLSSAKIVTAPSGYLKQAMEPYFRGKSAGTSGRTIEVLPNPIDIDRYPCRERGPARASLVWLRAFHEIYRPMMAVKVVEALRGAYPEVQLNMIGPDKGDGSFVRTRHETESRGMSGRTKFAGQIAKQDVPAALDQADIFLNTTTIDNTPVSVIEAMACGLCVVSTKVGGTPFLISDEQDGLLVKSGDVQGMANAVSRFLSDESLARHCSRNARAKVADWDWLNMLPRWEALLKHAAECGAARRIDANAAVLGRVEDHSPLFSQTAP